MFFSGFLNIKEVSVTGVDAPMADEIRRTVFRLTEGNDFFLSRGNILFFSIARTISVIENQFPILDNIVARKKIPGKIIIEAKERQKIGIVCGESADKTECFYFDGHGIVFSVAPEVVGAAILLLKDSTVFGSSLPSKKYDEKTIGFIQEIKKDFLSKAGVGAIYFHFLNSSGDISAHTDKNFEIYLASDNQQPEEQARILKSVLDNEIKDKISALEYIDLRVENRAYYKLRE